MIKERPFAGSLFFFKDFKVIKDLKVSFNYFFVFGCIFLPENLEGGGIFVYICGL